MRTDIRVNGSKGELTVTQGMRGDLPVARYTIESLFSGSTIEVAQRLIGSVLYRRIPLGEPDGDELLSGRIVEAEAYLPLIDPSCHGYRGPSKRNSTLFGRPGFAYVYLIYGMYYCINVTTEPPGIGAAVLIRALEPLAGIEAMQRRRGKKIPREALASGPGNLCRAMSIDLRCDGADFRSGDLTLHPSDQSCQIKLAVSGRIGLNVAQRWPLRFYDANSPSISPFRKSRKHLSSAAGIGR